VTETATTGAKKSDPYLDGIDAAQRLITALARHGIVLPSVRGGHPVREQGFVELGGCSSAVADSLACALEKAYEGK
jgi:hypothetical protein